MLSMIVFSLYVCCFVQLDAPPVFFFCRAGYTCRLWSSIGGTCKLSSATFNCCLTIYSSTDTDAFDFAWASGKKNGNRGFTFAPVIWMSVALQREGHMFKRRRIPTYAFVWSTISIEAIFVLYLLVCDTSWLRGCDLASQSISQLSLDTVVFELSSALCMVVPKVRKTCKNNVFSVSRSYKHDTANTCK